MAEWNYKNIPVDPETYEKVQALAEAYERKLGAQVRVMVNAEYEKLEAVKLIRPVTKADEGQAQA